MVVVITGASAGIGAALAEQLHAAGAWLVLSARREDRLAALNAKLGGRHLIVRADVTRTEDCRHLIDAAYERFGRLDTLVCNAGYGIYHPIHETSPQEMRAIFATNVFGTTDCIAAAIPRMLEQDLREGWRGQVVVVSSVAARRAVPFLGAYSATKAAQLSIAEAMRVELEPRRIAVTSVHPIMTRTEFGRTAEARTGRKLPKSRRDRLTQPVSRVARHMLTAIRKPRAEVWPSLPARLLVGVGSLVPAAADLALATYRDEVEAANRQG